MNYTQEVDSRLESWRAAAGGIGDVLGGGTAAEWVDARSTYDQALAAMFKVPEDVEYGDEKLGGVPTTIVDPGIDTQGRTMLYLHGGGYASGAAISYRGLAGELAKRLRAKVFVPDYRLAPQHPYPAPIDDALTAYRALLDRDVDPAKLVVTGDSAGGAMTLTVLRWVRDTGLPLPAAGVSFSPWADLGFTGASSTGKADRDPLVNIAFLQGLATAFRGQTPADHPDVSPVHADFAGLPPILLHVGEAELMLNDATRLAERLGVDGVRVTLEVWPSMFHVFQLFTGLLPQADAALESVTGFVATAFAGAARGERSSNVVAEALS